MISFATGTTRTVLCLGALAFKFALSRAGTRGNRFQADLFRRSGKGRRAFLCPVLWCSPHGAVLVMRRAAPMSEADYRRYVRDVGLLYAWGYSGPGDDVNPFEPKASSWGWLNGRVVAIDYANVDRRPATANG
jgi:hypothetical protein